MSLAPVEQAIQAVARGDLIVVLDDEDRENEGDLIFAAEAATPEKVGFMVRHTSGIVCAALSQERLSELHLPLMVADNTESHRTAFTVSVDYLHGTSTGISASDRALTLRALANPGTTGSDFARPGHIFPLRANAAGVMQRPGHTEAAVDFARLAGLRAAGVLCEVVEDDGNVARRSSLLRFADHHGLLVTSIADLIAYRRRTERWVLPVSEAALPTRFGTFTARVYRSALDGLEHLVMLYGDVRGEHDVPVRVHSECLTSEVFGSLRCDCRDQLDASLAAIVRAGKGALIYVRGHEGRGIGLGNKLRAYALQERGQDTAQANLSLGFPVDARNYDAAAEILRDLAPHSIRLMSNNPEKFEALAASGITITRRVRLPTPVNDYNRAYLRDKCERLGHDLELELDAPAQLRRIRAR